MPGRPSGVASWKGAGSVLGTLIFPPSDMREEDALALSPGKEAAWLVNSVGRAARPCSGAATAHVHSAKAEAHSVAAMYRFIVRAPLAFCRTFSPMPAKLSIATSPSVCGIFGLGNLRKAAARSCSRYGCSALRTDYTTHPRARSMEK